MKIISIEKLRRGGKFKVSLAAGESHPRESKDLILSKDVIVDYGLRRYDEISEETASKILDSQLYHDTYFAAMRLINYRMRTRTELTQRLREKSFPAETIERVTDRLTGLGLVDDRKFAEIFVAAKVARKPVGKRELERRLREKGIMKEIAAMALSAVSEDGRQLELATQAAEIKIRSLKRFDAKKRKGKLAAFLVRRGFDWSVIKKVIMRLMEDEFDGGDS